jgi:hypothetical protein
MSLFSLHCIARAFGTLGELTCIRMEDSILILYLSYVLVWCYPITKGAATEPRASCVLQPHEYH